MYSPMEISRSEVVVLVSLTTGELVLELDSVSVNLKCTFHQNKKQKKTMLKCVSTYYGSLNLQEVICYI